MRFFAQPSLLIIDELGYLPLAGEAALFQVVARRYLKSYRMRASRPCRGAQEGGDAYRHHRLPCLPDRAAYLGNFGDRAWGISAIPITRALGLRARRPELFPGGYEPLSANGTEASRLVAFCRGGGAVTAVPRLALGLGDRGTTTLNLPAAGPPAGRSVGAGRSSLRGRGPSPLEHRSAAPPSCSSHPRVPSSIAASSCATVHRPGRAIEHLLVRDVAVTP
jgi:hypothetical protein